MSTHVRFHIHIARADCVILMTNMANEGQQGQYRHNRIGHVLPVLALCFLYCSCLPLYILKKLCISRCDNYTIYRRSYMSTHVLLNIKNELGKIDKMRGLQIQ